MHLCTKMAECFFHHLPFHHLPPHPSPPPPTPPHSPPQRTPLPFFAKNLFLNSSFSSKNPLLQQLAASRAVIQVGALKNSSTVHTFEGCSLRSYPGQNWYELRIGETTYNGGWEEFDATLQKALRLGVPTLPEVTDTKAGIEMFCSYESQAVFDLEVLQKLLE